jgi:outer membrane phospholipase A
MHTPARLACCSALCSLLAAAAPAQAQEVAESSFTPFGESYALWNRMTPSGWSTPDEQALRAHYAFKYTVLGEPYVPLRSRTSKTAKPGSRKWEIFLAYTGEFDFYLGTRDSGPVINRISNPAGYVRVPTKPYLNLGGEEDNLYLSLEHRSNGQTVDVTSPLGVERARHAYDTGDRVYFDAVSRGANYFGVALEVANALGAADLDFRAKLRLYINQDADVTWGPLAGAGRRFSDYDRLQLSASYRTRWGWRDAGWRLGDQGLKTDSWTLAYQAPWKSVPLYVRYNHGPMNTLSNYTQPQNSVGIGLRFARPSI